MVIQTNTTKVMLYTNEKMSTERVIVGTEYHCQWFFNRFYIIGNVVWKPIEFLSSIGNKQGNANKIFSNAKVYGH